MIPGLRCWRSGRRIAGTLWLLAFAAPIAIAVWRADRIASALRADGDVVSLTRVTETRVAALSLGVLGVAMIAISVRGARRGSPRESELRARSDTLERLRRDPLVLTGVSIALGFGLVALLCPLLAPYDPNALGDIVTGRRLPPSWAHPLGTDGRSRDVLSRLLYGARVTIPISLVAVSISVGLGLTVGSIAGFCGRWIDSILMRLVDLLMSLPAIVIMLCIIGIWGTRSAWSLALILGFLSWMGVARLVRAEILSLEKRDFVLAARALGAGPFRIITRHLVPNALTPVIIAACLRVGNLILLESGLSYLGLGVERPHATWGNIVHESRDVVLTHWWIAFAAGAAIVTTVVGYNLLGDGLRDCLDPRATVAAQRERAP